MSLKVHYDPEVDVLYIARAGEEEQMIEISSGLNLEMNGQGELIGVEILQASKLLREVIEPLRARTTG